jgi:hypothetical protein
MESKKILKIVELMLDMSKEDMQYSNKFLYKPRHHFIKLVHRVRQ